jgi:DNA-binding CsgD family transcriptional regulator
VRRRESNVFSCDVVEDTPPGALGVRRRASAAPAGCDTDSESQVARAGLPVLARLAEDLRDVTISVVLTDADGNILATLWGGDMRIASATDFSWVEAPIQDPRHDVPVGSIRIASAIADADCLLLAFAQLAARTISDRIVDGAAFADRALLEQFLRARRRARGPILAVNDHELLANAAAARLVSDQDRAVVWKWVTSAPERLARSTRELRLRARMFTATFEPVVVAGDMIGAVVHLKDFRAPSSAGSSARGPARPRLTFGWDSLRASELGIAALVAEGFTNREIGARLFVSPHTVDSHLRQIYRKLSITSRIELTRLVLERAGGV